MWKFIAALAKEREDHAKLESDFQDLQSKFFTMKENAESQEDQMDFFARQNAVDMRVRKDKREAMAQSFKPS